MYMGVMYTFLGLSNILYLMLVPYVYNFSELIRKSIHILQKKPKNLPKVILGLTLDYLFTFSYQWMVAFFIFILMRADHYQDMVAYKWTLQAIVVMTVWQLANLFSQVIPIEFKLLKNVRKKIEEELDEEEKESLGKLTLQWIIFKATLTQFWSF